MLQQRHKVKQEVIRYNVIVANQNIIFINQNKGGRVVEGRELKLPSSLFLRKTKGGRVVQGREWELPLGWSL